MITKNHNYFILNNSPWPLVRSLNSFRVIFSLLLFFKFRQPWCLRLNILNIRYCSFIWWMFYRGEFNIEGMTTGTLIEGLKYSIILFISSEIFFFFSFFWSYFHFYLSPTIETGLIWPPNMVPPFDFLNVPLINTLVLISSGMTVTMSHHYLIEGKVKISGIFLWATLMLGVLFTFLQGMEYISSFFRISDSTFGTSFFMLTGFHGIHVIIGTIFLTVILVRFFKIMSSKEERLRFEIASWYWHFVDVVWIFLYYSLYYLNN